MTRKGQKKKKIMQIVKGYNLKIVQKSVSENYGIVDLDGWNNILFTNTSTK